MIPDGVFSIAGAGRFFLEADRSTSTNARYTSRLKAYFAYDLQEKAQAKAKKEKYYPFRVLTITITPARAENLRLAAKKDGLESGLFWFASERSWRDSSPASILEPVC